MDSKRIGTDIIAAFQKGDMAAFRAIYDETKNMMYSIAQKLVKNDQDIEDIMHDVYLRLYEQRDKYNPKKAKFTTWAYRVALNHALNMIKPKKWLPIDIDLDIFIPVKADDSDSLERMITDENLSRVSGALKNIPVKYRICLVMKEIEELSYQEIADILGINIGTVRSRIYRAKDSLKKILVER
ncbi:MAG: RNA polymerase sigma factor [Candidatus Margulisiibacteriota bacterium]